MKQEENKYKNEEKIKTCPRHVKIRKISPEKARCGERVGKNLASSEAK